MRWKFDLSWSTRQQCLERFRMNGTVRTDAQGGTSTPRSLYARSHWKHTVTQCVNAFLFHTISRAIQRLLSNKHPW